LKARFAQPDFFHRHRDDEMTSFVTVMQKIQATLPPFISPINAIDAACLTCRRHSRRR
jgi:hypothetical protein